METSRVVATKKSSESNEEVLVDRASKKSSSYSSNEAEAPSPRKAKSKAKAPGSIMVHRYRDQIGGLDIQGISSLLDLIEKVAEKAHLPFGQMYMILG